MTVAYRYRGPARYLGVPSRDITQAELVTLGPRAQRTLRAAALQGAFEEVAAVGSLADMTRADLDEIATGRGMDPGAYRTKADLVAALEAPAETPAPAEAEADTGEEGGQ
jgi:hypothetical protein